MLKKNTLRLSLLIFSVLAAATSAIIAQTVSKDSQPQKADAQESFLQRFLEMSALPSGKRQRFFSDSSNDEKAGFFKLHLALQFIKRPNLTKEQREVISEAVSKVSPDTYDKSNPDKRAKAEKSAMELQSKALGVFAPNEAYEIFASLGGEKDDVALLQKYLDVVSLPTMLKRRKAFRESLPTDKSNLIKAQMAYYLATYEGGKERQGFLLEAITLAVPDAFSSPNGKDEGRTKAKLSLEPLRDKANKLFSEREIFTIFMSLGTEEKISTKNTNATQLTIDDPPPAESLEDCGCVWWCSPCHYCKSGGCKETTSGCGFFLDSSCTGKCVFEMSTCPR